MAYGVEGGTPFVMSGNNDFLGGNGIGSLLIGALLFGGGLGGFGNRMGTPAASAVATDIVLNPAFQALGQQVSGLSSQINSSATMAEINSGFTNTNNLVNNHLTALGDLATAVANGNFTTLNSINGLGRDVTAQSNTNALVQLNSFNALNTAMLQGFNEVGRDAAIATNQIIAGQNAAAAAMASCCCEIKSAIRDDGDATRALINALNVQNLQSQLADAKQQNSTLSQTITQQAITNAQTATILQHLVPRPVTV